LRLRLHYQGSGHADPVLIAMIEVFSELGSGDALKRRFFELPSVASCVECHAGAKLAPAAWKADPHFGKRNDFTRFAHRPHLSVSALGSCVYCHQIRPAETDGAAAASTQTVSHPPLDPLGEDGHEFLPLSRRQCAACHTAEAAGDRCVQCHRYHVEW
jgi:hypothetical protein